jgi:uncharacterized protein (TIGR00255 family)
MILSMTGYGTAEIEDADLSVSTEVRAVNNRYLKTSFRLPEFLTPLEPELDRVVRECVTRGALTVTVRAKRLGAAARPPMAVDVLESYVTELRAVASRLGLKDALDLSRLLELPGVFDEDGLQGHLDDIRDRVVGSVRSALADFAKMRAQEGKALEQDLRKHAATIRDHLNHIDTLAPTVVIEYRDRLKARVEVLLKESGTQIGEENLLTEVSLFAERSDISEEVSRMKSHLDQFDEFLDSSEPTGRKLEFLAQEMLREANTIGSKSGHPEISRRVVEIKAAIDRIKEQVQNAE